MEARARRSPALSRPSLCSEDRLRLICVEPQDLELRVGKMGVPPADRGAWKSLGNARLAAPPHRVVRKTLVLQLAALSRLEAIARLDLPASTPFELKDVYVGVAPRRRLPEDRIEAEVAILPRSPLEPWLAALRSRGQDRIYACEPAPAGDRCRLDWMYRRPAGSAVPWLGSLVTAPRTPSSSPRWTNVQ